MSTIKNLVKTFKEREKQVDSNPIQEEPVLNTATQPVTLVEPPKVVQEVKMPVKQKKVVDKPVKEVIKQEKTTVVAEDALSPHFSLSDDFFAALNEQSFSYEKSKFAYIDKKIYEVLMTLKRKKDVKNVSTLINAALSQFIEQNKEEIKTIFMQDLL